MEDEVITKGGYATESMFKDWLKQGSYLNWGILSVSSDGIKLDGKKGSLDISISDITNVSLARKELSGKLLFYLLFLPLGLLYIAIFETRLLENILFWLLFIIFITYEVLSWHFLSTWIKVTYMQNDVEEVLYFGVSWGIRTFVEFWYKRPWMWKSTNFLSWRRTNKVYNILNKSLANTNIA